MGQKSWYAFQLPSALVYHHQSNRAFTITLDELHNDNIAIVICNDGSSSGKYYKQLDTSDKNKQITVPGSSYIALYCKFNSIESDPLGPSFCFGNGDAENNHSDACVVVTWFNDGSSSTQTNTVSFNMQIDSDDVFEATPENLAYQNYQQSFVKTASGGIGTKTQLVAYSMRKSTVAVMTNLNGAYLSHIGQNAGGIWSALTDLWILPFVKPLAPTTNPDGSISIEWQVGDPVSNGKVTIR